MNANFVLDRIDGLHLWCGREHWCQFLLVACLAACSTPREGMLPPGAPVQVVMARTGDYLGAATVSDEALKDAVGSHYVFALAQAGMWAAMCAPTGATCAIGPAAAVAFGVPTVAGAVLLSGRLPPETVAAISERAWRFRGDHDPYDGLELAIAKRSRRHWPATEGEPARAVTVELTELVFQEISGEKLSLVMKVRVSVRGAGEHASASKYPKVYQYVGPPLSALAWTEAADEVIASRYEAAYDHLAGSIVSELVFD